VAPQDLATLEGVSNNVHDVQHLHEASMLVYNSMVWHCLALCPVVPAGPTACTRAACVRHISLRGGFS
jgi:hypothetical protein